MDILSLRLFIRIAELGGVTAAAHDLSLSPASASARLVKLEEIVGFRLFNRTTRAVDGWRAVFTLRSTNLRDSGDWTKCSERAGGIGTGGTPNDNARFLRTNVYHPSTRQISISLSTG